MKVLEFKTKSELDLTIGIRCDTADRTETKKRTRIAEVCVRCAPLYGIKHVEHLSSELQFERLRELKVLRDPKVPLIGGRRPQRVALQVTKTHRRGHGRERRYVQIRTFVCPTGVGRTGQIYQTAV